MKLLIIQLGIATVVAALTLCVVPTHNWPSLGWRGRAVDNVTGFRMLQKEPVWIKKLNPASEPGFAVSTFEADIVSNLSSI